MGISTVASLHAARRSSRRSASASELVDEYFTGTAVAARRRRPRRDRRGGRGAGTRTAYPADRDAARAPPARGRRRVPVAARGRVPPVQPGDGLQAAARDAHAAGTTSSSEYTDAGRRADAASWRRCAACSSFEDGVRPPVPIDEVEPVERDRQAVRDRRDVATARSRQEAHETLAIAMNRLGGKSNTGEGGEDADALRAATPTATRARSAIKQVASGRFGVTSEYLVNADDLQIKMAQGAKPGEGGQLPGHKVYPWIAKTRHSTPGVGLISPPPHHDIYSIEDLAQLIHDLKNANPQARVHVKLVAEVGVGTVAAGVAKAHADVVLISGHDGGTGAVAAHLAQARRRAVGARARRDAADAAAQRPARPHRRAGRRPAEDRPRRGRSPRCSAPRSSASRPRRWSCRGCIMMRVCHLDTCPVGVATQNPELRKRFTGKPEFVVNFFEFIAEEVRELPGRSSASASLDEVIGRVELLDTDARRSTTGRRAGSTSRRSSHVPELPDGAAAAPHRARRTTASSRRSTTTLIAAARAGARATASRCALELPIRNVNRTVGTMLGSEVTRRCGGDGPARRHDRRHASRGSAGQSFGAFVPRGHHAAARGRRQRLRRQGPLRRPAHRRTRPRRRRSSPRSNIIAGNVIALRRDRRRGRSCAASSGERFCVRNSGATAVVEGVGDHGCEYMTGGRVVVLGPTGRNFARRHVAAASPTCSTRRHVRRRRQPRDGRPRAARRRRRASWLRDVVERAPRGDRLGGGRAAARRLGRRASSTFVKVMPQRLQAGARRRSREAERDGLDDVDEAIMAAAHG